MKGKNEQTITKAFARFTEIKHYSMLGFLKSLMPEAVQFALDFHEMGPDPHGGHLESGGNYGWMIVYNGQVVDTEVYTTENNEGDVREQLTSILPRLRKTGYVGVVMAGMRFPTYFSVDFEEAVMDAAIQNTIQNFHQYFKKL